ncbi:MAG: hypothetical protein ACRBBN_12100 [Methyloligellaceae bacterium]
MTKLFKIALVSLAVVAGVSSVQAGSYGHGKSVIDQVLEDQKRNGN